MGRRSRKRGRQSTERPSSGLPTDPPRPKSRRRRRDEQPPPAPWGSFPLAELCIGVALVLGIAGAIVWGPRGRVMLASAAGLGSLAGLELAIREHLAGYRSHTQVLAAVPAVVALTGLYYLSPLPGGVALAVGVVVFVAALFLLRDLFRRRSGGLSFR